MKKELKCKTHDMSVESGAPSWMKPRWDQIACNFWTVCPTDICLTFLKMATQFLKSKGDKGLLGLRYDGAPVE